MSNTIRGSVAQLAGRIVVNGVALGQPELSMLTRIGRGHFCKPVEVIRHEGKRGKPTTVWEFNTDAVLNFAFANAVAAAAVANGEDAEAPAVETDAPEVAETATPEGWQVAETSNEETATVEVELTADTEL